MPGVSARIAAAASGVVFVVTLAAVSFAGPATPGAPRERLEQLIDQARDLASTTPARARELADEALLIARGLDDAEAQARALKTISVSYYHEGDLKQAVAFGEEALAQAERSGEMRLAMDILHNMGLFHRQLDEYTEALACHERILELLGDRGEPELVARARGAIAAVRYLMGDLDAALESSLEALQIQEDLGRTREVAELLNTIAVIHDEMGQSERAEEDYRRSLALFEEIGDTVGLVNPLNNLGTLLYSRGDLDQAESVHRRVLELRRQLGDRLGEAVSLNNLGNVARERGDLEGALTLYTEALTIRRSLDARSEITVSLRDIGALQMTRGHLDEALDAISQSLALAREIGARSDVKAALRDLADVYERLGDHRRALASYREFHAVEQQMLGEQAVHRVAELEARFEAERREKEIESLRKETELQRRLQTVLAVVLALILLLSALVWNRGRLKHRANRLLADKNQQIAEQNARLEELNWVLEDKNREYYASSITDGLTGTYNKASILDTLERAFSLSRRHDYPLACVFFDLDHFKAINDTHGHLAGDQVLAQVAAAIRQLTRTEDSLGRYGGEEFLLVLPNTRLRGARTVAEKIRQRVEDLRLQEVDGVEGVTLSAGIAELLDGGARTHEELLRQADAALYEAKARGRNRVESYRPTSTE